MLKKLKQPKYVLPIGASLFFLVFASIAFWYFQGEDTPGSPPPLLELDVKNVEVSAYQYLGSWPLPEGFVKTGKGKGARKWRDSVRLSYDDNRQVFEIEPGLTLLKGSVPQQITPVSEDEAFKWIRWQDNQVSIFAFRALSPEKQTVVVEIDTDNPVALYVNGKLAREVSTATDNEELGTSVLIPVGLEAGENVFMAKVFSSEGPPRLRVGLTLDGSKDFQAAWNRSWGFLNKLIHNPAGNSFETPVVRWDSLLERLSIGAEVYDVLNGKSILKMDAIQRGDKITDGGRVLGEGIYKITYKPRQSGQEKGKFEESFHIGAPRKMFDALTKAIDALSWSDAEKLNIEAQLRRARILFRQNNYKPGDRSWEERVLFTLGNLAEFVNLKKAGSSDIFKNLPGLRLRGFVSKIDNSKQFYRLFVPSNRPVDEKLPLLVFMPTTLANKTPFLESPFVAAHNQALQVSAFAEKHGFAVLWPAYRSVPMWWTYESAHAAEALEDVEKFYNIDSSRISVFGTCAGGFYAGRLASIYPRRFAAIVYERAILDYDRGSGDPRDPSTEWIRAINPSDKIIANKNIQIILLNDGSRGVGRGELRLSREFLARAQAKGHDVKHALGQREIGRGLWNMIFEYLADCRNEHPDKVKADIPAASGYAGPISEVFATPFLVVEGTRTSEAEAKFMDDAIKNLRKQYREQFLNVNFVRKKDTEITDEDIEKYSLVLVGNAQSNAVWGRLAAKYGGRITPHEPVDEWLAYPTESAFAEVFKNPANRKNYLLLIGSNELKNMALLKDFVPFTACFDSFVLKKREGREREYVTARR